MKKMLAAPMLLFSLFVPTTFVGAEEITQTRAQYEVALRHSDYLLHITVVDDRTGEAWTGCALTGLLFGALTEESKQRTAWNVNVRETAMATALSNTSRVFHFSNPKALYNMTTVIDPSVLSGKVSKACAEMKKTGCMRQQDLTGQFVSC